MSSCPINQSGHAQGKDSNFQNCKTDWSCLMSEIHEVLMKFHASPKTIKRKTSMNAMILQISYIFRKGKGDDRKMLFPGAGSFTTGLFIQLMSILGLIPFYFYSYAEIIDASYGPGSLMRLGANNPKKTSGRFMVIFTKSGMVL